MSSKSENLASLPIVTRYSLDGDIELCGAAQSLKILAHSLRAAMGIQQFRIQVPEGSRIAPYAGFLEFMKLVVIEGSFVNIAIVDNSLVISGGPDKLEMLAENIAWLTADKDDLDSKHIHIEYYPEHFYLAPSSMAMVVALE
jgi:hypothetical protein